MQLWFYSNDHEPPHFHVKRKGEWEYRVNFLRAAGGMFEVIWSMKKAQMSKSDIEFIAYGGISSVLTRDRRRRKSMRVRVSKLWKDTRSLPRRVFISFSHDLDESFVKMFRGRATGETRLLIFNEGTSTDLLISKILDLQIRTPERYYVVECKPELRGTHDFLQTYLDRFRATLESDDEQSRILDARIESDILRVVSPEFVRQEIPISKIPQFKSAKPAEILNFEIDGDGAFIYWPDFDVHLGWRQLRQLINPDAAFKAAQKGAEFNKRYGKAVQKLREGSGLKRADVPGLSEKQIARIEKGECRLTTNAIEALSKMHKLDRNEYMKRLGQALG